MGNRGQTLLLNRNKHSVLVKNFVLFINCISLNIFTNPLPYHCSCVFIWRLPVFLSNSTYKLSTSADMIVKIQVTKLITKLLAESHWR